MRRVVLHSDEGISLPELMIASFLALMVSAAVITWMATVFRTDSFQEQEQQALEAMRFARGELSKDVRFADGVLPVADDKNLVLWIDDNRDDIVDTGVGEVVTWRIQDLGGGKAALVRLDDTGPASAIVKAFDLVLADSAFTYVFGDAAAPSRVTGVAMTLTADIEPGAGAAPQSIQTEITLRN